MKSALPFVGMVISQAAQVGTLIAGKQAILTGMTNFTFVFYSNAIASLILLPSSFLIHRSRPPLTFSLICQFFGLGLLGCLVQLLGYAAVQYTPASFASAMVNLIPGFTFILAVILRMEKADCGSSGTLAKSIGTAVSIIGAFVATLYQGPPLLMPPSDSNSFHHLFVPETNLVLGGSLFALGCAVAAVFIIAQAFVVKKYPAELIILFFYCFFITIQSAALSVILEGNHSSWSLQPSSRLLAVLYSGVFGSAFQVGIGIWCIRRTGPLFVAMFHPLGIIISAIMGIILLGDSFYLGTLLGSIVIVIGFYAVMWGKAKEGKLEEEEEEEEEASSLESTGEKAPLLQNNV